MPPSLSLWQELSQSLQADYFNLLSAGIFSLAILHAFLVSKVAQAVQVWEMSPAVKNSNSRLIKIKKFFYHLLGEVEAVFVLWAMVLVLALIVYPGKGWGVMVHYLQSGSLDLENLPTTSKFIEPVFVFMVMVLASTKPIIDFTSQLLNRIVKFFGGTPAAAWFVILTVGPILGSLITEPAAMTIAALLLSTQFYCHSTSLSLRYATIALLFVNTSVGGALTHFAAPPIVMVAGRWGWGLTDVFNHFGLAALLTILLSNVFYFFIFRRELTQLKNLPTQTKADSPAVWIISTHLLLIAALVLFLSRHQLVPMTLVFLSALLFMKLTARSQHSIAWRSPILVGGFLAGLVVLGGLQSWWIAPILVRLDEITLMVSAVALSAFNDNAMIAYLAAQVPMMSENTAVAASLRHAVIAGALAGGGMTVIANAPNPAGQSILSKHFDGGVSPGRLALWALIPTLVAILCFWLVERLI